MKGLILSALVALSTAVDLSTNLNYHSPSTRHSNLGIDLPIVQRRTLKRDSVPYSPDDLNFTHGIASGDPYPTSVILWTRVAPSLASDLGNITVEGNVPLYSHETERYIKADPNPICVDWAVWLATTPSNSTTPLKKRKRQGNETVVANGRAYTTSDIDFTVKVEATGLSPFTEYNYQFTICGSDKKSEVGRTKTTPGKGDDVSEVKLAVFSCSNFPNGYFNAYGNAARKGGLDYVIHLGDYIYESAGDGERAHNPPRVTFTLGDYRTRHGQYRTDPDLQLLTAENPLIATWDDHEVANNGYRDGFSALNNTEASFRQGGRMISVDQRKMNAVRAYFEWMPIRQVDLDDNLRIWRSFQLGNLADLIILDTRNYDRSITSLGWNDAYIELIRDEASRSLMGGRQENWFYRTLKESKDRGAKWRIIGSQVIFSGADGAGTDTWGGYTANRNRTLQHIIDNKIDNNVFLAGDSHRNWVSDVTWLGQSEYNPTTGSGSLGVEFAGTAVSSSGRAGPISAANTYARDRVRDTDVLQWHEGYYRGYFVLSVQKNKVTAGFFGSPTVATRNAWELPLANLTVLAGENKLSRPIAGGKVEAGFAKGGTTTGTNLTLNTETKKWEVVGFDEMFISR
ncbi:PhoD-like phosphatase-domain-containing protein [Apiosordaria backusii]|uniref:PhoD-like phosphatase-domain-containing protein n=1 Tax=Apiosordaria backusii TaxID=314023 RepID=A0AA40DIH7_9PEZI|nr:PhoD-like phosphatase-domain-containing protein [Apiosordaria backusii]